MDKEFSPEERLLHLIKKNKQKPEQSLQDDKKAFSPEQEPVSVISPVKRDNVQAITRKNQPGDGKEPLSSSDRSKASKGNVKNKPLFTAKDIILVFFVAFVLFGGYIAFDGYTNKDNQEMQDIRSLIASISDSEEYIEEMPVPESAAADPGGEKTVSASSLEDYKKIVDTKAVFALPASRTGRPATSEALGARDILKEFKLVGIMPGNPPQAIIEDIQNKQTLFLKEGEMIDSIQVRQILTGRVMLGYNEEIITLSL
jgi:hypothetical protein